MKNVLISNPNSYDLYIYLPYIYGVLRRACDQFEILKDSLNWLTPIYDKRIDKYDFSDIDILGMSCYTWNREINYTIAKIIKKKNPNCIIIAGGPDPDSEDNPHTFLNKYPLIDIIVKRDADYSFPLVMQEIVNETYNYKDITGLYINGIGDTGPVHYCDIPHGSVYSTYSDVFTEIAIEIENNNKKPVQVVESDRGCPYSCAFCYRGRYDNKKTYQIPLEYVYEDIEWGGKNRVRYVDIGNSNWGRYKRDTDVAKKLIDVKRKYGYPKLVFYSGSKTNSKNMADVLMILNEEKMLQQHAIALQTTNKNALEAAKRVNMSNDDYLYLAQIASERNIPGGTQFIMGCPGDNYDGVKQTCSDVMDMGLVDIFMVLPYQLLPGSWAYTKEYRDEWQLETVIRHNQRQRRKIKHKTEDTSETEYIVGCKTYTREDYIKMWRYYAIFLAFVGGNISRYLSIYLKLNHGIEYKDFYTGLVEDFFMNPKYEFVYELTQILYEHQSKFVSPDVSSNDVFWEFPHHEMKSNSMYEYDECILISILLNFDKFKKEFSTYIVETCPNDYRIPSLILFQFDTIITQDYNQHIWSYYDWVTYFKKAKNNRWLSSPGEPVNITKEWSITQTHCGTNKDWPLKWNNEGEYINTVVGSMYTRNGRSSFDIYEMEKI